jgi:hypothetical protein
MKIGGWKTKAMFSGCKVANKDRLRAAMVTGGRHVEPMSRVSELLNRAAQGKIVARRRYGATVST